MSASFRTFRSRDTSTSTAFGVISLPNSDRALLDDTLRDHGPGAAQEQGEEPDLAGPQSERRLLAQNLSGHFPEMTAGRFGTPVPPAWPAVSEGHGRAPGARGD